MNTNSVVRPKLPSTPTPDDIAAEVVKWKVTAEGPMDRQAAVAVLVCLKETLRLRTLERRSNNGASVPRSKIQRALDRTVGSLIMLKDFRSDWDKLGGPAFNIFPHLTLEQCRALGDYIVILDPGLKALWKPVAYVPVESDTQ